ncbi:hypothetical protein FQA39_LY15789 [Lamprigera yunnana]|nr:hypothetical protein FQA39_LY15789 [Lamprigera yunnana]
MLIMVLFNSCKLIEPQPAQSPVLPSLDAPISTLVPPTTPEVIETPGPEVQLKTCRPRKDDSTDTPQRDLREQKLCELDDRVLKLEDNNVYLLENVISEINKRNSKECNCIIYKLEDSENAVKKDIELFKNLLACCNDEPSFNINDIKLIRLGKKFKSGVDRPLKVVFPNKDCLHWFFS